MFEGLFDEQLPLPRLVRSETHRDERGWVSRSVSADWLSAAPEGTDFVEQTGLRSVLSAVRGFHVRTDEPEWKLVRVARGLLFDAIVDARPWSESFGQISTLVLTGDEPSVLLLPPGFAHGNQALTTFVDFTLTVSCRFHPVGDEGFHWLDPDLAVAWPMSRVAVVSPRDREARSLADFRSQVRYGFGANHG